MPSQAERSQTAKLTWPTSHPKTENNRWASSAGSPGASIPSASLSHWCFSTTEENCSLWTRARHSGFPSTRGLWSFQGNTVFKKENRALAKPQRFRVHLPKFSFSFKWWGCCSSYRCTISRPTVTKENQTWCQTVSVVLLAGSQSRSHLLNFQGIKR